MCFSISRAAIGVGGLLLLAGCTEPTSPTIPQSAAPVASTRTKVSDPELDLENPLGASDEAAMLRQAPDYSITPSALMSNTTMGVSSGVGVDSLPSVEATLPGGDLPGESQALPNQAAPAGIDLKNEVKLDLEVSP